MMDASILRSRRHASLLFPVLVALTAGPGILSAANLLQTYASNGSTVITSVTLTCNTATGPGASATIVVKPLTALVSPNQIIVSATPLSASGTVNTLTGTGAANVVITAPGGGQTLTAAITSLTYTISLATTPNVGCVGLTTAAPTFFFNHIAGTTSVPGSTVVGDVGMIANTTLTNATSGLVAPATMNLTCIKSGSTYYPGAAQTVSVTSTASNGTPFTVDTTVSAPAAWAVLNPSTPGSALATSGTPITFTVAPNSVCNSLPTTPGSNTATTTIHLINAPMATDKIITVTLTVNAAGTSSLVVNPSPVNITCAKSAGGAYTPNYPQMVSVTSAAGGGTAFTVDKTTSPPAAWLVFTPTAPAGTAGVSPITFTLSAAAGCGAYAQGTTNTTTVHLLNAPSLDKVFTVTLQIVPTTILAATPGTATVSYVKGSGTAGKVDINITSTNGSSPFFSVNTATLPIWLTVDSASGIAPKSLRFSSTTVADTLAPGTYAASVLISVSGYGDLPVPISLLLTSKASQLSVQGSTTQTLSWTIGQALPTTVITAISTGTPIAYTATTGGTLGPVIPVSQQNGLAYSFGTPINVSFSNQIFAGAQPGTVLTGTVTLTWGSPASTIVVTFKVNVVSPGATVSGLSPASVPTGTAGYVYTVVLTGTGFVPSTDVNQKTKVGVVTTSGAPMVLDAAISANVVNPSNITLTITVPNGVDSAGIPFAAGGSVNIGVCNPVAGVTGGCSIATGVAQLFIGTNPIIQAVTSSSAFLQGVAVSVAPYDIISIFGANFCPSCTSSQLLTGSPDATTLSYATSLAFDSTHSLSVTFQATSDATPLGSAPLLFANNSQINLLVPSGIAAQIGGGTVDIIVNYGSGSFGTSTLKSSAPFTVTAVATDPGIFTIGADGQGNGAALDVNYNLISSTNPAGIRTGALGTSDIIAIYMTGLGAPDDANLADNSTAAVDNGGSGLQWSTDCVTTASYLTSFNAAQTGNALGTLDGALIIPSVLNTGRLVPCISTLGTDVPTVTIGGVDAPVKYAGWVAGTIAGLYQVNVQLPVNTAAAFTNAAGVTAQSVTAALQLPVVVTANSIQSQAGVVLWVAPRLVVTGPSGAGLAGTVGIPWVGSSNAVAATEGTGTITYVVSSGVLPSGLSLDQFLGTISGTPAAHTAGGTYIVTVTATDSAAVPVKGTTTFTLTIAGGLYMTRTTPSVSTYGAANSGVSTVVASSGVSSYTYSIAISGFSLPSGLTINAATGVISTTTATPAGTYSVTVSAHDSTSGSQLTGSITFPIVVKLHLVATVTGTFNAGVTEGAYNTMVETGQSGSPTYVLDTATAALSWVTFDPSTGIVSVTSSSVTSSRSVTVTVTDGTTPSNATSAGIGSVTFTMTIVP